MSPRTGTEDSSDDREESLEIPATLDEASGRPLPPPSLLPGAPGKDPVVGQILGGRYRVIERLAEGGMGTVYRAEHLGLHKEVAIKLVNESAGDRPDHALRFLREAMLTSRIDHPNVVTATDYGTFEDGTAFLAMTLVAGPTLASVMEAEKPMRWRRAAEIGAQIADAISAAQAQGIVHRDLKPENLVLQPMPDGTDIVKVLDFGIAKYARDSLAPPAARGAQQATRVGVVVGTPGYMAPEQAVGMRADHRADLYAMGVMLWECVVGKKLWDFDDMQRLMAAQLNKPPPPVRRASGDESIPDAFEALIAALLATRPEQRPQNAAEVRDALRVIVAEAGDGSAETPAGPKLLVVTAARPAVELRGAATSAFRRRPPAGEPPDASELNDASQPPAASEPRGEPEPPAATRTEASIEIDSPDPTALPPSTGEAELALRRQVTAQVEAFDPSQAITDRPGQRAETVPARGKREPQPIALRWWIAAALGAAAIGIALWPEAPAPRAVVAVAPPRPALETAAPQLAQPAPATEPAAGATTSAERTQAASASPEEASPLTPSAEVAALPVGHDPAAPAAATSKPRAALSASEAAGMQALSADELRATAREAFQQGDFRKSTSAYRMATKKAPTHAGAHAGLGASLLALGDAQGAIAAYRRAIELAPGTSGFHAALGRAYLLAGDRTKAIASYRKAVALDPSNQTAFAALAQLAP